VLQGNHSTKTT